MNKHVRRTAFVAGAYLSAMIIGTPEVWAASTETVFSVQQTKSVSGTVVDSNGIPVIGANILEKGTTNGTITDIDGNFTLSVSPNAILQISFIGYNTQEVAVGDQKQFRLF